MADLGFLQVEGLVLGKYPKLGEGFHISRDADKGLEFKSGRTCLRNIKSERVGLSHSGVNFMREEQRAIRNMLTGLLSYPVGYPGVSRNNLDEPWLQSARGLAVSFYKDNLATAIPENQTQLFFVPMVLSPKPVRLLNADWTPEAQEILREKGWAGLIEHCGTHFVEVVGEEHFVVYSLKMTLPEDDDQSRRIQVNLKSNRSELQTLGTVLREISRLNQSQPITAGHPTVHIDILQVGASSPEAEVLKELLSELSAHHEVEPVPNSFISRTRMSCAIERLEPCRRLAEIFLDYQFGRLMDNGVKPSYAPVRFRMAPMKYLNVLNEEARGTN